MANNSSSKCEPFYCRSFKVTIIFSFTVVVVVVLLLWGLNLKRLFSYLFVNELLLILYMTATFPLDLVRRRMQLEGAGGRARVYNTGLFGTFGHIVRTEGPRGLYRGILPEYYKVVPSVGIVFMTYESLKKCLSPA